MVLIFLALLFVLENSILAVPFKENQSDICKTKYITQSKVGETGYIINTPGIYRLAENIHYKGIDSAIIIASSDVQINFSGFGITTSSGGCGIEIYSGSNDIKIYDGFLRGFSKNGIIAYNDLSNIHIEKIKIIDCGIGIEMKGSAGFENKFIMINACNLMNNDTGILFNFVKKGVIRKCLLRSHTVSGIDLRASIGCQIFNCTIKNVESSSKSTYGILLTNGRYNRVSHCQILGVSNKSSVSTDQATGIFIDSSEKNDVIENNKIDTCFTTNKAQPFGINISYDTKNILKSTGLPFFYGGNLISRCAQWSPDGRYIAMGRDNGLVTILQLYNSKLISVALFSNGGQVNSLSWSPDGRYLVIGGNVIGDTTLRVLEFNGKTLKQITKFNHGNNVFAVSWSPNGRYIGIAGNGVYPKIDTRVLEFTGKSLNLISNFYHGSQLSAVDWSPDGNYLVIGGVGGLSAVQVLKFDGRSLSLVTAFNHGAPSVVRSTVWSDDGKFLAISGTAEGLQSTQVRVLEFTGSSLVQVGSFSHGGAEVLSVCWSPDGKFLVLGGDSTGIGQVRVLRFTGSALTLVANYNHGKPVRCVDWSDDGRFIAMSGDANSSVNLRLLSGFSFPSSHLIMNNFVTQILGASHQLGVLGGRGIQASSGNNVIIGNFALKNDVNFSFMTLELFKHFVTNIKARNTFPNRLSNIALQE